MVAEHHDQRLVGGVLEVGGAAGFGQPHGDPVGLEEGRAPTSAAATVRVHRVDDRVRGLADERVRGKSGGQSAR
jgi:hypothetical protein